MSSLKLRRLPFLTLALAASLGPLLAQDIRIAAHGQLASPMREASTSLAFSGDGKLLGGDSDGNLQCWDLAGQRLVGSFKVKSKVLFAGFLSGDRAFAAVDESRHVTLFDLAHGGVTATFQLNAKPLQAAMDAGKQYLAVARKDGVLNLFDLKAGMPFGEIDTRGKLDAILFLGFDRLGQQLLAIDRYGKVLSWNTSSLKLLRELELAGGSLRGASQNEIKSATTNRAANVFAVGLEEFALARGAQGLVYNEFAIAYDWSSGMEVKRVKSDVALELIAMGPGNDHIATVGEKSHNITLMDLRKGETAATVTASDRPLTLAVSEDNHWLAAGMKDGRVLVWTVGYKSDTPDLHHATVPGLSGRVRSTSGTEPALKPGVPVRLAILNFVAKGVEESVADICLDSLTGSLSNHDYVTLVERNQIKAILAEQKVQASGLTDESTSARMGRLLNADLVLTCSIGRLGTTLVLDARLLNVETGKVVQAREVICEECRDQDIFDAVRMLSATLAQ